MEKDSLKKNNGSTIMRCGLLGGSVSLWEWDLRSPMIKISVIAHFLLPAGQDIEPSVSSSAPGPPACCHDGNVLN